MHEHDPPTVEHRIDVLLPEPSASLTVIFPSICSSKALKLHGFLTGRQPDIISEFFWMRELGWGLHPCPHVPKSASGEEIELGCPNPL